jgi:hypothetical protein
MEDYEWIRFLFYNCCYTLDQLDRIFNLPKLSSFNICGGHISHLDNKFDSIEALYKGLELKKFKNETTQHDNGLPCVC